MSEALTRRQAEFVRQYLVDWNGTQAAIRAGYSPKGAKVTACRLLTRVNVMAAIGEKRQELVERVDLRAEAVLRDLEALKAACMTPDDKGKPKDAATAARVLELQGRYLGLWSQERQGGSEGIEIRIVRRNDTAMG